MGVSLRPDTFHHPCVAGASGCVVVSPSPSPAAGAEVGCLLPLFDLLNHKSGQPIRWEASGDRIIFRAVGDIKAGAEVFNNYGGSRSNEQLLFYYGFAEPE